MGKNELKLSTLYTWFISVGCLLLSFAVWRSAYRIHELTQLIENDYGRPRYALFHNLEGTEAVLYPIPLHLSPGCKIAAKDGHISVDCRLETHPETLRELAALNKLVMDQSPQLPKGIKINPILLPTDWEKLITVPEWPPGSPPTH